MSRVLVHRCPHCKSDRVIQPKPKDKSDTQVGLEFVGGFIEGAFLGTDGSITDMISKSYYDPSKQHKYLCRECGHTWDIDLTTDETPINVLESEKSQLISKLTRESIKAMVWMAAGIGVAIWSYIYCQDHEFKTTYKTDNWLFGEMETADWHYSWLLVGLIFIIASIVAITSFFKIGNRFSTIAELKKMDPSVFRNSKLRP